MPKKNCAIHADHSKRSYSRQIREFQHFLRHKVVQIAMNDRDTARRREEQRGGGTLAKTGKAPAAGEGGKSDEAAAADSGW